MLEKTFVHIPGIGVTTERSLWKQGCLSWDDLATGIGRYSCGSVSREVVERTLKRSIAALQSQEHQFFKRRLGLKEAWRAFPDFRRSCVYLDIETDGGPSSDSITTIGLYDGKSFTCLVKDEDLGNFPDVISRYSMIVTFYGIGFDIPMLQKSFRNVKFDQIHIDLHAALKRLGHRGGLKKIEQELGIMRGEETAGLTGLDAIRLWRRYRNLGDDGALKTLIAYNRDDVVNLEKLAEYAYAKLWDQTFLGS